MSSPAHRSPWQSQSDPLPAGKPLNTTTASVDVCVVGAGIAGLLCALELAERGRTVAVLERESVAAGDTSMTTAHLTAFLDTRYRELTKMHSAETAQMVARSHVQAIAHLERVANAHEIECEFRRVSAFLCAANESQVAELVAEQRAASAAGIACELVKRAPLAITSGPALHIPNQAQFDALKFVAGVVRALERRGVALYAPAPVESIEPSKTAENALEVRTRDGQTIQASDVIVATGSPINDIAAIHTKQAAYRTYGISAEFPEPGPGAGLHWDMEDPYHYVRTAIDATTERQVLIVGGEDHRVGQDPHNEQRFEHLVDWMRERFPQAGKIVSQWSGQVFEPSDGLAFIGRNPGQARVFVVTGESGNGMTYAAVAAQLIADLVQGKPNALGAVYDPTRKPHSLGALGDFVKENLNTAEQYTDWLSPADVSKVEEIARGQGAVLRRGLRRVAVYVDEAGAAHELSATCPHLGGVVAWNPAEKSWDCPCHGSRFDCHGKVLQGPAITDLKPEK